MVWMNCVRSPPVSLMRAGQEMISRIARAPEVTRHLLGPLKRRVHRVGPGGRKVVEVFGSAELVDHLDVVLPLLREAVEEQVLAEGSIQAALSAGSVVAGDVDDERIVGIGERLDRVDDAAHLVVALGPVAREYLHHPRIQALLIGVQGVPRWQSLGPNRQLGVFRHDAQPLLPFERLFTIGVPALVELALELLDPVFRRLVGGVRGAWRDVQEVGFGLARCSWPDGPRRWPYQPDPS